MSERVARDGDTVTVRDYLEPDYPDDRLTVEPWDTPGLMAVRIGGDDDPEERLIIVDRSDLAALAHHLLDLAGEPDWEGIARKLGKIALPHSTEEEISPITAAEWAALEGAEDGE